MLTRICLNIINMKKILAVLISIKQFFFGESDIDYFSIIGWGVILLIIFWFALGDLEDPKSDCEKAFEYHKDYEVLDQCRRNTILREIYDG